MTTTYNHMKLDDTEVQVESAVRDGAGQVITETYQPTLTAGDNITITDNVIDTKTTTEEWTFTLDDGTTVTKVVTLHDDS